MCIHMFRVMAIVVGSLLPECDADLVIQYTHTHPHTHTHTHAVILVYVGSTECVHVYVQSCALMHMTYRSFTSMYTCTYIVL